MCEKTKMTTNSFDQLVQMAGLLASLAAAVGLILLYLQTRETMNAAQFQATLSICQELDSMENRKLRKDIYLLAEPIDHLSPDQNDQAGYFCASLNRLALLVNQGFADRKVITKYYGHVIILSRRAVRPFVLHVRSTQYPIYLVEFERLAEFVAEYWSKRDLPLPNRPNRIAESDVNTKDTS